MKNKSIITATGIILICAFGFNSCSDTNETIKNAVETAVKTAISNVPAEFQTPLANYIDVAAKGVYSIDGTPTVNELVAKVIAFIPQDIQQKFPLIITAVTTTITLMYITYGKSGLTAIGQGMEAGAAPYISRNTVIHRRTSLSGEGEFVRR